MAAEPEVEEEVACDFDDPLAMLGGMGEEEEYKVTFVKEANAEGEEEAAGDFDDPFAMMGGMGEEQVYKVTLVEDAVKEEANENEDPATKAQKEKDGKRAEIAAKVAAAQAQREMERKAAEFREAKKRDIEEKGTTYFGEHMGITCDACATIPIFGYRYLCKTCKSHDICESCYDAWAGGTGVMPNGLNKQVLSTNPADHSFVMHKDKTFKAVVKGDAKPTLKSEPKLKPNDTCSCGSGKKYKKCCMKCT